MLPLHQVQVQVKVPVQTQECRCRCRCSDAGDDEGSEAGAVYVRAGQVQLKKLVQVQVHEWYSYKNRYTDICTLQACVLEQVQVHTGTGTYIQVHTCTGKDAGSVQVQAVVQSLLKFPKIYAPENNRSVQKSGEDSRIMYG